MPLPRPAWHPDPAARDGSGWRWWDGTAWTDARADRDAPPDEPPAGARPLPPPPPPEAFAGTGRDRPPGPRDAALAQPDAVGAADDPAPPEGSRAPSQLRAAYGLLLALLLVACFLAGYAAFR